MLFWIYIIVITYFAVVVVMELFSEKDWKKQIGLMMVLVTFILRILQIK